MWMDGIYNQPKKRNRPKRKPKRAKNLVRTVSARTKERNADRRRRMTIIGMALAALAGLGWVSYVGLSMAGRTLFTENPRFLIRQWDLKSNGILTPVHIKEYSQLSESDNLFAIDLSAVQRRLESVAIIKSAQISRRMPDTLVIRVQERLAVARLGPENRVPLAVDRDGHILGPSSVTPQLPSIVGLRQPGLKPGVTVTDPLFSDALRLLEWCDQAAVSPVFRVRAVQIGNAEQLEITLSDGARVLIDRLHMEARLNELVQIIKSDKNAGRLAKRINMTGEPHIPPVVTY